MTPFANFLNADSVAYGKPISLALEGAAWLCPLPASPAP
jgi:hypothetical protein